MKTASCCLAVFPFPWAINAVHCIFLWKTLTCGKCALGRGRSQAVLACSVGYCHFPPPSLFLFFSHSIICMTFKTLQNGGQLLLGFNYKLTRGHIISPRALAYYSRIWEQWRPVARVLEADTTERITTITWYLSKVLQIMHFGLKPVSNI